MCRIVDLPAPFGPRRPVTPAPSPKLMSLTATTLPYPRETRSRTIGWLRSTASPTVGGVGEGASAPVGGTATRSSDEVPRPVGAAPVTSDRHPDEPSDRGDDRDRGDRDRAREERPGRQVEEEEALGQRLPE